jgi:hypothetical protein
MVDARFTCHLEAVSFKIGDEKGWVMGVLKPDSPNGWAKKADHAVSIRPNGPVNFVCGPDEFVTDFHLNNQPARLRAIQLQISIDYAADLYFTKWWRHYESDVFSCDVDAGECKWFSGPLLR